MDVNGDHMAGDVYFNGIVDCSTATEIECRDNELGYMFYYNLGGSQPEGLTGDQGLFENISLYHWSATEYALQPWNAWNFAFIGFDRIAAKEAVFRRMGSSRRRYRGRRASSGRGVAVVLWPAVPGDRQKSGFEMPVTNKLGLTPVLETVDRGV